MYIYRKEEVNVFLIVACIGEMGGTEQQKMQVKLQTQ